MRHYLTNMQNHLKPLVEEAIQLSRRGDIHIDDDPMPTNPASQWYLEIRSTLMDKLFSIYADHARDCSDF